MCIMLNCVNLNLSMCLLNNTIAWLSTLLSGNTSNKSTLIARLIMCYIYVNKHRKHVPNSLPDVPNSLPDVPNSLQDVSISAVFYAH